MSLHHVPIMQVTGLWCYQQIKALPKLKPSSKSLLTSPDCSSLPTWAASVFSTWVLGGQAGWQPAGDKEKAAGKTEEEESH